MWVLKNFHFSQFQFYSSCTQYTQSFALYMPINDQRLAYAESNGWVSSAYCLNKTFLLAFMLNKNINFNIHVTWIGNPPILSMRRVCLFKLNLFRIIKTLSTRIFDFKPQSRQSAKLFSSRRNRDSPQPLNRRRECPPPLVPRGGAQLAGERGGGRVPIPTRGHTLWCSVNICNLCFKLFFLQAQ